MAKSDKQVISEHAPWKSVKYETADTAAIQALAEGRATSIQQKRALDWIVMKACGTYDFAFRPGPEGERDTVLALGRQFVGLQIVYQIKLKLGLITRSEK